MPHILRSVRTNMLEIAYEESGPADGETLILLHGWPDSVRTWDAFIPALVDAGYHCLAPSLRGFGATRFLDSAARRSGQATALTRDVKDFVDALTGSESLIATADSRADTTYSWRQ